MDTETAPQARVFLRGDPMPIGTTLTVEQVLAKLVDAAIDDRHYDVVFVRLPYGDGRDAVVRPDAIAAILPPPLDDEE